MVSSLVAEVIVVAIAVAIAGGITAWAVDFSQERTDETSITAGQIIDCTAADLDIPSVYLLDGQGKVQVSNVGLYENLVISSSDMVASNGLYAALMTALPIPDFTKGLTKEILFSTSTDSGNVTCSNFRKASVVTDCAKVIYDAKPVNC